MTQLTETAVAGVETTGAVPGEDADLVVFTPYRAGVPNLRRYLTDAWGRRHFAFELARTDLRSQHFNTVFGMVWLILNPLMLTFVYFLLTSIIGHVRGGSAHYLSHLMSGLFAYYLFMQSSSHSSNSVVKGGKLIMNTAFPKVLLPISAVFVGIMRFIPTIAIYLIIHAIAGQPFSPAMLWGVIPFAELVLFTIGFAMLVSSLNVYFRDLKAFLPYMLRIWLYLSPVLYYIDQFPHRLWPMKYINPLFPILGTWTQALGEAKVPGWHLMIEGAIWAAIAVAVGGYVFISRERDFAVRI